MLLTIRNRVNWILKCFEPEEKQCDNCKEIFKRPHYETRLDYGNEYRTIDVCPYCGSERFKNLPKAFARQQYLTKWQPYSPIIPPKENKQ